MERKRDRQTDRDIEREGRQRGKWIKRERERETDTQVTDKWGGTGAGLTTESTNTTHVQCM